MKILKYSLMSVLAVFVAGACNNGIDPISRVDPGPDGASPIIDITYPDEEIVNIPFTDEMTNLNFQFEVIDDIEIASIVISVDDVEEATFTNFKDYRRAFESYMHKDLPIGDHSVKVVATDLSGKSTTETFNFEVSNKYIPKFDGEIFYMPFEGELYTELISETSATVVGDPGFAGEGAKGAEAYAGATGAYLTFPTTGLLGGEFSATFWIKTNASPDRAGILVIGPPDPAHPDAMNNRTSGFRFFREGGATSQIFKLNVGNGAGDNWFDGGAAATVNLNTTPGWVHMAFTISSTQCKVYINGAVVSSGAFAGVDWSDCDVISIASGDPRFTEWGHHSDKSFIDEIRFYNKALSQQEVQATM